MAGTEVGAIEVVGEFWDQVFVGYVESVTPHPNADRLRLATIRLSEEEEITVVCGAPNINSGQKIAFAKVGATLIDSRTGEKEILKSARIRGIESSGMVCSARELGMGDDNTGILVLSEGANVGEPLADILGDVIFDLELTPNRSDCFSVLGIAREISALSGQKFVEPDTFKYQYDNGEIPLTVTIDDVDLCRRYTAIVIENVKVGPSPLWMQDRLIKSGQRPINNVVDITNYVMLEYGQPLHAFDLNTVKGGKILVRPAKDGEEFETLDGTKHILKYPMLVICDAERSIGLAGVMGGLNTEIREETTTVLLESANFDPINTRRTAQALRIRTEAASRFEKGLQPELAPIALRRAMDLIIQLSGGVLRGGIVDIYPQPRDLPRILFSMKRLKQVLGMEVPKSQVEEILSSLGFILDWQDNIEVNVTIPYWRSDISQADDLVEEIARIIGYDEIPTTMLSTAPPVHQSQNDREFREDIRDALVICGMQETISYPLTTLSSLEATSNLNDHPLPLRVAHPMSSELEYLRTSLRGSVIATLSANQRHSDQGFKLFELGRVYIPRSGDLPLEREMAVGIVSGLRLSGGWLTKEDNMDFFDAKGILEAVFNIINIDIIFEPGEDDLFIPGRCARVISAGSVVGIMGEINDSVLDGFEIELSPVILFELDVSNLLDIIPKEGSHYKPLSRYPGAYQDLAVVLDNNIDASAVKNIIERHSTVVSSILFDLYEGEGVQEGKRSLAYRVLFQSVDRTLTGDEVNSIRSEILKDLNDELGASLRG
jgi:phenylalanyl-tRNA synthetase beta chain